MIEVEKTLPFGEGAKNNLISGAEFLGEKILRDTYYDQPDFSLGIRDWWLRERNGKFELKIPVNGGFAGPAEQYDELEEDAAIAQALGLNIVSSLPAALRAAGYAPFGTIVTTRQKYKKEGFNLDFDETDSGFRAVEIELMVKTPAETEAAAQKIAAFAELHGLENKFINGKVIEFLRARRPEHFTALDKAGVVYH